MSALTDAWRVAALEVRRSTGLAVEDLAELLDVPADVLRLAEQGRLSDAAGRLLLCRVLEQAALAAAEDQFYGLAAPDPYAACDDYVEADGASGVA